jgi:hypothetical protein
VPTPPSNTAVQPVAQFQPIGESSSLALVATPVSLTVEEGGIGLSLPNQPGIEPAVEESAVEEEEGDPTGPDREPAPVQALLPLARFLCDLDEMFERARRDASRAGHPAGVADRAIRALDAALGRWSPVLVTLGGPSPALTHALARLGGLAARVVDAALG